MKEKGTKIWTEEEKLKAIQLFNEFKSHQEIADILERPLLGVRKILELHIPSNERKLIVLTRKKQNRICNWDDPKARKDLDHKWYLEHKDEVMNRGRKFRYIKNEKYIEYKKTQKCSHCENNDFRVICFHHIDKNKEMDVSNMLARGLCWNTIFSEIKKCIPLCMNCHTILHYEEREKNRV